MATKTNSRTKNTLLNLVSGLGGEIVIYALNFVTRTIFIQTLGRSYLGIGGLFTNILTLLSLTDMGVMAAMNYRLYKPLKEKNTVEIHSLMDFYRRAYFRIGFIILALGLCVIPFLRFFIKDYDTFAVLGIHAGILFFLYLMQSVSSYWFYAYKSAIIKADQKEYYINLINYVLILGTNILQIIVLLAFNNYMLYISTIILMNIVTGFVNAVLANKLYPFLKEKPTKTLSKTEQKEIWKDCRSILLFSINSVVVKATDNLVLSAFIGLDIVGLYSNYLIIYNAIKKIIKKCLRAAQASIGNLFAGASGDKKYEFFNVLNFLMVVFCGTASVCIALLSDEFIQTWIGHEFVIAMPFSILIALELYTIGLKLVLEQMRDVIGLFQQIKWRPLVGMVLNIVISVTLVQKLGIAGVILGTLISEWVTTLFVDPVIIHKHGFGNKRLTGSFYLRNGLYIIELVIAGIVCWKLNTIVVFESAWVTLIVHGVLDALVTLIIIVLANFKTDVFKELYSRLKLTRKHLVRKG